MLSEELKPIKEKIGEWIETGAVALNMGNALLRKDPVCAKDYDILRRKVKECLKCIKEAKSKYGKKRK
jgi:2-keto-3-deoxy-6-phosphogluconate aldolase